MVQIACEFRLVKTAGAWYTIQCAIDNLEHPVIQKILTDNKISDKPEDIERFFKFQGANNLSQFLNDNPEIASFVYDQIKELF